ncbi:MAG: cysteine desulfurase NifS, partial [Planctomycetes bacterium]|nr:cysteine desulfurase NifS [Planctomycetota bacterium]
MTVKEYIYCDYAAGAPCRREALGEIEKYALEQYSNPGAHHPLAYIAKHKLEDLHRRAGACIGADPREIIFT